MAKHIDTGKTGEKIAVDYLTGQGFTLLEKNWRHGHWEVDVIASKEKVLHFIEIKTRRSRKFGYPEEDVTRKKVVNLINAAEEYLIQHQPNSRIQFDILSIYLGRDAAPEFFFIEDVGL